VFERKDEETYLIATEAHRQACHKHHEICEAYKRGEASYEATWEAFEVVQQTFLKRIQAAKL